MKTLRPAVVLLIVGVGLVLGCLWLSSNHGAVAFVRDNIPFGAGLFLVLLYAGAGMTLVSVILFAKAILRKGGQPTLP